jgi:hypothetical protein
MHKLAVVSQQVEEPPDHARRGRGQSCMAWTLARSMATLSAEMMWPKYAMEVTPNAHLDCLTKRWCWRKVLRTARMWQR